MASIKPAGGGGPRTKGPRWLCQRCGVHWRQDSLSQLCRGCQRETGETRTTIEFELERLRRREARFRGVRVPPDQFAPRPAIPKPELAHERVVVRAGRRVVERTESDVVWDGA